MYLLNSRCWGYIEWNSTFSEQLHADFERNAALKSEIITIICVQTVYD